MIVIILGILAAITLLVIGFLFIEVQPMLIRDIDEVQGANSTIIQMEVTLTNDAEADYLPDPAAFQLLLSDDTRIYAKPTTGEIEELGWGESASMDLEFDLGNSTATPRTLIYEYKDIHLEVELKETDEPVRDIRPAAPWTIVAALIGIGTAAFWIVSMRWFPLDNEQHPDEAKWDTDGDGELDLPKQSRMAGQKALEGCQGKNRKKKS